MQKGALGGEVLQIQNHQTPEPSAMLICFAALEAHHAL